MLRAPLLLALAPEPACGARDGDGAGAHAACRRPDRRPAGQGAGEQASRDAEFGIPMTAVAKSRFHTATHAVPVVRGSSVRPLFVTAAGMPAADAADLVWHTAGRYRPPDALRGADTLARADPPAGMTARQPD
jgi:deoxyribonuclease V